MNLVWEVGLPVLLGDGKNRTDCGADAYCANEKGSDCGESGALKVVEIDRHGFAPVSPRWTIPPVRPILSRSRASF